MKNRNNFHRTLTGILPVPSSYHVVVEGKSDCTSTFQLHLSLQFFSRLNQIVEREVIIVETDSDLLLATTVNKSGKDIEFRAAQKYHGFQGTITINFPPFAVLAEEKIYLEVIPATVVEAYNKSKDMPPNRKIATPILHIDRKNDVSFLNDVKVTLPLISRTSYTFSEGIDFQHSCFSLSQSKFSPVAIALEKDEEKCILRALRVDTNFSIMFRPLGVYLLIEQNKDQEFKFNLRQFETEEEHREYRMDERKSLRMIVNPQHADLWVYGTDVTILIKG